ncbi:polysaccharide pyruvyl transferase family protein [Glaciibacter flavus]|uniref:polysaccharide pyruvyl transferase family protein n=1 Tax=Orlajensenia flava TaxID=2565934 RepID=UPI003AFFE3EB
MSPEQAAGVLDDRREIFVPGIGQYDNIGDIILRRQLVSWLRPHGRLHVFVGGSPSGYAESLGIGEEDVVYRSFSQWYRAGLRAAWRGRAHYLFKPGEIQLTVGGMKEHVVVLPLLAVIRARGGKVARVGAGSRNFAPVPRLLMRPSIAMCDLAAWRDAATADYLGGEVMPDLAFGEGGRADPSDDRDVLVVSMRSDRVEPSDAWFDGIREYAARSGLRISVVTQVLRDRDWSRMIARRLGAELVDWDGTEHGAQEERLRDLYRRSVLAVSDRLHVLITAATEGAIPIALLVDGSDKIERHFEAAGLDGVGVRAAGMSSAEIVSALEAAALRGDETRSALASARGELDDVRTRLGGLLAAGVDDRAMVSA